MAQSGSGHRKIVFGDFRLESESRTLWRGAVEVHLAKRPFDVLQFLIENRERVVSRNELLDKFWEGCDVYDDALRKCVGTIRKAIDDNHKPPHFIETRYGDGFRFIGAIEEEDEKLGTWNLKFGTNKNQKPKIEDQEINFKNRYIFIAVLIAGLLFFVSLGFYVYLPKGEENPANNLMQNSARVRSIAVLPLKNLTGEANNEYFSDGVTESIISELSRVNELKIVSRSSTFAFKDKEIDPREVGRKLNVDAILEGSLQKKGDLLSVSVRLISTRNGSVLWTSRDFERPLANAYELKDTISRNIAIELRTELSDTSPNRNTTNPDAYQNYLKGRFYWNKRTGEGIKKSIEFYEQAIKSDENFASAYAGLAESYMQGIWHVPFVPKEVLPKAKTAALKAVELDDTLSEAHTALGNVFQLEWNFAEARREMQRAVELNPRNARAFHVQAFCFHVVGRNDEAVKSIERAFELDPLNLVVNTDRAQLLFIAGRTDEAFAQWQKTLELDPNFKMAREHLAMAYQVSGNEKAAIEENIKVMRLNEETPEKINAYRQTAEKSGLKEIYRQELKDLLEKEKRGEKISNISAALRNTWLGQTDEAFKYLEKAYFERDGQMLLLPSPMFSVLRSDSRFQDLMKRIGLEE